VSGCFFLNTVYNSSPNNLLPFFADVVTVHRDALTERFSATSCILLVAVDVGLAGVCLKWTHAVQPTWKGSEISISNYPNVTGSPSHPIHESASAEQRYTQHHQQHSRHGC